MGFDTFNVGPELEYFLFEDDKGTETLDEGGYFAMTTMDAASELRQETVRALEQMGIPIEYVHHEVGPSQHEIDMRFAPALEMADHTLTYRLIVKEIAKKAGYHATFMPKPIFGENGSGMHTHQSLFNDGRNSFFDADDEWNLSDAGKAFIAGQLHHAREISAIFAQWVNSYKRLVPGYEAPVYVAWSRRNRSAADPNPALQAGERAGDARRDPLSRSGLQPVPHVRRAAPRRSRRNREGLRAARADGDEPLPPDRRAAEGAGDRVATGDARRGDRRAGGARSSRRRPSARTSSTATSSSSGRSGTTTASSSPTGRWIGTCRCSEKVEEWIHHRSPSLGGRRVTADGRLRAALTSGS